MSLSSFGPEHKPEDLQALRRLIARLALPCGLDLSDKSAVRRFLDGAQAPGDAGETGQELRAMLILLFRLETCSSEDLGFAGLRRLWLEHSETLARYYRPDALPTALRHGLPDSRQTAGE
ncbi:hypothetical protein [Dechloromonas denitrificans]|uniref:hypothetical protein n=1 Tax=Dechloromonas denitrificans TaxID=281362 RepID=UPI001CF96ED8|nr:hypothetical protein [Dechloromonas denitrificans]UCV09775.1 hypothetical protein KI615_09795 [Dechloromonas denitrificans]